MSAPSGGVWCRREPLTEYQVGGAETVVMRVLARAVVCDLELDIAHHSTVFVFRIAPG